MQTFMPEPSFMVSLAVLDDKRLNKQKLEAKQILLQLLRGSGGYKHHPINDMWCGYEKALALYGKWCCEECRRRGFTDNLWSFFACRYALIKQPFKYPSWFGDNVFHDSHRSNLLRKGYEDMVRESGYKKNRNRMIVCNHYWRFGYSRVGWGLPYVWKK